jgi:hypothetical protein
MEGAVYMALVTQVVLEEGSHLLLLASLEVVLVRRVAVELLVVEVFME